MTRIESKTVQIAKSPHELYTYLQDMNNFKELLPQDRISDWQSDGNSCSFKVQGAATIGLKIAGGTEPNHLQLASTERSPFPFTLDVHLEDEGTGTKAWQIFNADLNTFIKMMVEKPLKNLFDHIADKMVAIHGGA
jgi:carbon monoxide dehydrogenase subunit G